LLDHFTVLAPADDYLPNVVSTEYPAATPQAVQNSLAVIGANANNEDMTPVEGLININTAPWRVLAAIPWVNNNPTWNAYIARSIVKYRETNGPFRSIYDLNAVKVYNDISNPTNPTFLCNLKDAWWTAAGPGPEPDADDDN